MAADKLEHGGHGFGAVGFNPGLLRLDVCEVLLQLLLERGRVRACLQAHSSPSKTPHNPSNPSDPRTQEEC